MSEYFNDSPIENVDDDKYEIASFAKALAKSIREFSSPIGTTIAINGPWGVGKSSAVNLIRSELQSDRVDNLTIIDFKCWWYRGEEALTLAFFQELNSVLKLKLGDKVKNLVPALGKHVLQAGPVLGTAVSLLPGGGLFSPLVSSGADFAKRFFPDEEPLDKTFKKLSKALGEQDKRFLVIIDDIDRLSGDEALAIFRLVKSVGRLPNVMYLLIFDRKLADDAVQERYPSEGPHFLEKIIQASFELPAPPQTDLNNALLAAVEKLCGPVAEAKIVRFMNLFYDGVAPYLATPRHVTRLINAMSVTWPAVANEVDLADFVLLETLRLYQPELFSSIRAHRDVVTGDTGFGRDRNAVDKFGLFIAQLNAEAKDRAEIILQRLFPALESITYAGGFRRDWDHARRVCIGKHFDTYFRLSLSDEVLPISRLEEIIDRAGDPDFVKATFLEAGNSRRKSGKTMVPVILDELTSHAGRIARDKVEPFLSGLFSIVDNITFEEDAERGFSFGNTPLRVQWLIRRLTSDRFNLEERSALYLAATTCATRDWLIYFTSSAVNDYKPKEDDSTTREEDCLTNEAALPTLIERSIAALRAAAIDGSLLCGDNIFYNLYRWREFSDDDGAELKNWLATTMSDDENLVAFAKALTGYSWSQEMGFGSMGDRVAKRNVRASVPSDFDLFDLPTFRKELERIIQENILPETDIGAVQTFLTAWDRRNHRDDN